MDLRSEKAAHIVYKSEVKSCWIEQFEQWYRIVNKVPKDKVVIPM
jgi:hypothetical protein